MGVALAGSPGCRSVDALHERTEASAWEYSEDTAAAPVTQEALQAAVEALVGALFSATADPVLRSYDEAMEFAAGDCPTATTTITEANGEVRYWESLCHTDREIWFKGPMTTWAWTGNPVADGSVDFISAILAETRPGFRVSGRGISGQTDIYSSDGVLDFNCSCAAMMGLAEDDAGTEAFFNYVDGPTHWTGPAAQGSWMEAGLHPGLWMWAERSPTTGLVSVQVSGNVSGFHERFGSARLDLNLSRPLDGAAPCLSDPPTQLRVLLRDDESAEWLPLDFTVRATESACLATASFGELALEVALDGLLDWEERPW